MYYYQKEKTWIKYIRSKEYYEQKNMNQKISKQKISKQNNLKQKILLKNN